MDYERFWDKVQKTPTCWLWTGCIWHGYGRWKVAGKSLGAHRVSYELAYGFIPDGFVVHNRCGNRACVNPQHLEAVSYHDNTMAAIAKGTHHLWQPGEWPKGEQVGVAKLTAQDVLDIRRLYASGELGYRRLGRKFGVDRANIKKIVKRQAWRHI